MVKSELCTDVLDRTTVVDLSIADGRFEGGVADTVDETPSSSLVGSTEPDVVDANDLLTKFVALLSPEDPAGTALIPETAPRVDGWKEKLEAEVPVLK